MECKTCGASIPTNGVCAYCGTMDSKATSPASQHCINPNTMVTGNGNNVTINVGGRDKDEAWVTCWRCHSTIQREIAVHGDLSNIWYCAPCFAVLQGLWNRERLKQQYLSDLLARFGKYIFAGIAALVILGAAVYWSIVAVESHGWGACILTVLGTLAALVIGAMVYCQLTGNGSDS